MRGTGMDVVKQVRKHLAESESHGVAGFLNLDEVRRDLGRLRRRLRCLNTGHNGCFRVEFSPHLIDLWHSASALTASVGAATR